jgi:WD40 repeat protein
LDKIGEWETAENEMGKSAIQQSLMIGLVAIATSPASTLLAMPGRQAGHVQLVSLPPCQPPAATPSSSQSHHRSPIILAHNHPLSTLACTANGSHVLTTSERGTLLRVWDTSRGRLERELRRGVDRADMWGVKFEDEVMEGDKARKGGMVVGWSDKGTIHVWEGEKAGESPKP